MMVSRAAIQEYPRLHTRVQVNGERAFCTRNKNAAL